MALEKFVKKLSTLTASNLSILSNLSNQKYPSCLPPPTRENSDRLPAERSTESSSWNVIGHLNSCKSSSLYCEHCI